VASFRLLLALALSSPAWLACAFHDAHEADGTHGSTERALSPGPDQQPSAASAAAANTWDLQLRPVVEKTIAELQVPGAIVGVWRSGRELWVATFGVADVTTGSPMERNCHVRVGSITKTFTGTVIMQLADEGKLALDDPIAHFVAGVPNGENITLRQLGEMTSGLYNYSEDEKFNEALDRDPEKRWTNADLLRIAFAHDPYFAPGAAFHYSNTNTILLGLVIEKATRLEAAEAIRRRILRPLGMTQTSFPKDESMPAPYASGYMFGYNAESEDDNSAKPLRDVTHDNPSWTGTAGQLISTLDDLRRYARPLVTGRLTSEKMHRERMPWDTLESAPFHYGFSMASYGGAYGHNGQIPGYQSFLGYIPDNDTTLIILTNLFASPDRLTPADQIAKAIIPLLMPPNATAVGPRPPGSKSRRRHR
jgi:D-alanyl-D-alanine carboxypeptidase